MRAQPGDWLLDTDRAGHTRQGLVEEVHGRDGGPPYLVRWTEDDHRTLVFPGPRARVLTPTELDSRDAETTERVLRAQTDITGR
ncbi:DUF1918 domain-containing protein [Actinokineospora auranticolor]|uniref:Uncharacterized protein DUF1918 n=1 Tax=Actinokineospora auranticolor TaxID=155976 RepID=A0A2S6GPQ4_9PSEU|nr:DUF1918 domain-containing protein [Actinokineospora auranticolor]PPK67232.1 uncharacterized protein DUF1918 [Actinokineospora auranticolor]